MKTVIKLFSFVLLLVVLVFGVCNVKALASDEYRVPYIVDEAGILYDDEYNRLLDKAENISNRFQVGVYVIILSDFTDYGYSIENAAENIYYDNNLGFPPSREGGDNEGLLLLLSMEERDYDINAHGYIGNSAFSYDGREYLKASFLGDFAGDYWYSGLNGFLDASEYLLEIDSEGTPYKEDNSRFYLIFIIVCLAFGLIGAGVNVKRLKRKMISVELASSAHNYVEGDVDLDVCVDKYLYTTTQVIVHSKSSGGGGGGGGSSHSSGKF